MEKQMLLVRVPNPGIACDFCEKTLSPHPEFVAGNGWSYVWSETEVGPIALRYATCSECCDAQQLEPANLLDRVTAGINRARRHSNAWADAVDALAAKLISTADVQRQPEPEHG